MKRFDAIVIGTGQAGPPLARRLATAGQNVAIVERKLFGGTCVNTGCIPTKTLVASARVAQVARRAADYGVLLSGSVGFNLGRRGYVVVDDVLPTSVPRIWALGECNGHGAFTHTAYNDYEIVAANLLGEEPRGLSDRITAYAIYIDPPLGRAGLSASAARKTGRAHLVGERPMTGVARAVENGETQGFMRAVVDAETKRVVGATILGPGGDEAIHALLYAMHAGATAKTVTRSIGIHPTVSELLPTIRQELRPLA